MFKRITALIIAAAILPLCLPPVRAHSAYMGGGHTYYRSHTTTTAPQTNFTVNTLRHSGAGLTEEHIISFSPNAGVRPIVIGSEHAHHGGLTIDQARNRAIGFGYDVAGGVNASFFHGNMTTVGMQIRGGIIVSYNRGGAQDLPSIGFGWDGRAIVGDPGLTITVSAADSESFVVVDALNYVRGPGRIHMYTSSFSETTRTTQQGLHVAIRASSSALSAGRPVEGVVTQVMSGTDARNIGPDEFVLSVTTQQAIDRLAFLKEGDPVVISAEAADERWNHINASVAGLRYLVRDGQPAGSWDGARAPRTAAGVRADGSVVLYTVDGRRRGHSNGLSLGETAGRMIDMGCVVAIELDGGGSTAMTARMPGETESKLVSRPSDGIQRRCANYIILANTSPPSDGRPALLFPRPAYFVMMPGVTLGLPDMLATDSAYRAVPVPSGWVSQTEASSENPEVVTAYGIWFTSQAEGVTSIHYSLGGASGKAQVDVVSRLDALAISDAETGRAVRDISVNPGREMRLAATGSIHTITVASTARNFTWDVEGDIGTISPDGVFIASEEMGVKGQIIVSGGGQTVTLPVTVGPEPLILEDFHDGLGALDADSPGLAASVVTDINKVERGVASAELAYVFEGDQARLEIEFNADTPGNPQSLWVLVTGDGSGNELFARAVGAGGTVSWVSLGALDFTGIKTLVGELPQRTASISHFALLPRDGVPSKGSFLIHQVAAAWAYDPGNAPDLVIEEPYEDGDELVYTVTAQDWNGFLPKEVKISLNGGLIDAEWDEYTAEVRLPLPEDGLYILSADAMDSLGRRVQRVRADYFGRRDDSLRIYDAADKWYTMYVDFLDDRGILDAEEVFGLRYYRPEGNATRLEVTRMFYRALKLPPSGQALPFDDISGLSAEDLEAVRAVYAAGLVSGKLRAGGTLSLDPDGQITRAELFTILNKTIPRGYEKSTLSDFSDTGRVPSWALSATQTLVGMGVVSGANGRLNPNNPVLRAEVCSLIARLVY
jgi:hypothetical protein